MQPAHTMSPSQLAQVGLRTFTTPLHLTSTMCTCLQGHTAENCSSVTVILIPSFYFHLILVFIVDIEHLMMMGRNVVMRGQSDVE